MSAPFSQVAPQSENGPQAESAPEAAEPSTRLAGPEAACGSPQGGLQQVATDASCNVAGGGNPGRARPIVVRDGVPGKHCSFCAAWGPASAFTPTAGGRGVLGCTGVCKPCRNAALRAKAAARPKKPFPYKPASLERIWARVSPEPNTGCWLWTGGTNSHGYGQMIIRRDGKAAQVYTHRLAFALTHGRDERTIGTLDHRACQTPTCCNPGHLEEVTPAENTRRGRKALITKQDAVNIRSRYWAGEDYRALGAEFGLSPNYIRCIAYGKRWVADMGDVKPEKRALAGFKGRVCDLTLHDPEASEASQVRAEIAAANGGAQ